MPDSLLVTEVSLPRLRHLLILRQFSERVQDGHFLTPVSATAGYGKTTPIRMWLEEAVCSVAWVTLKKSDNELKHFITSLLSTLQQAGDHLSRTALEVVEYIQEIDLQHILGLLINNLCDRKRPIVRVLDDYHLLTKAVMNGALECLTCHFANFYIQNHNVTLAFP